VAASRNLKVIFSASTAQLSRAFRTAGGDAKKFGNSAAKGGEGLRRMSTFAIAAGAATAGVLAVGLKKAATAAVDAEASNARLAAQLTSMGKNTAQVRGQIDQTVQSLSAMSGFDDEDLQDAFTSLVRTTGDVAKAQGQLGLIADVARGRQISLAQAAAVVNRVNAGSVGGLRRLGIEVDKNTTKEEGLAKLRQKFAGQAEAFGNTAAGAQERLRVATENAFEAVGVALTPVIAAFANFAATTLPKVIDFLMRNKQAVLGVAAGLGVLWGALAGARAINTFASAFSVLNTVMKANPILRVVGLLLTLGAALVTAWQTSETFRNTVTSIFNAIRTAVTTAITATVSTIRTVWSQVSPIVLPVLNVLRTVFVTTFNQVKTIVTTVFGVISGVVRTFTSLLRGDFSGAVQGVRQIISSVFNGIKGLISNAISGAVSAATQLAQGIANAILRVGEYMVGLAGRIVQGLASAFTTAVAWVGQKFLGIGKAIVEGIKSGISNAWGAFKDWLLDKLGDPIDWAKGILGIGSPSRVFANQVGAPMAQGIGVGFASEMQRQRPRMQKLVASTVKQARSALAGMTSSLGGMVAQRMTAGDSGRLAQLQADEEARNRQLTDDQLAADERRAAAERDAAQAGINATAAGTEERLRYEQELASALEQLADVAEQRETNRRAREIADLQSSIESRKTKYEQDIANLTASFNSGKISATQFQTELNALIGGPMGAELGSAFALEFNTTLSAIETQIRALASAAAAAITGEEGPAVVTPKRAKPKRPKKPKTTKMARGGILRRAVIAGEAGPEAVIPLTSARAGRMLAQAVTDAGAQGTGRGPAVINLTFNGVLDAREAARVLQPELNRIVSVGY
jgi:hypothetical protein